jgi:hypothetical protein
VTTTPAPIFPPGRYGRRREPHRNRRWLAFALLLPVLVGATWLAVKLYSQYSGTVYNPIVSGFTVVSDHRVDLRLDVEQAAKPAVCRIQATDPSSIEVGYAEVPVPAGSAVRVSYSLTTTGRATGVEVLGCSAR